MKQDHETIDEVATRNAKKVKKIDRVIWFILIPALVLTVSPKLFTDFETDQYFTGIQSLTLICVVFYLKFQIDRVEKKLSSTKLIMIHVINFVLLTAMFAFESIK